MFSPQERRDLRESLVAAARLDERVRAVAVVGSAAANREDEWSDIDLAFRLATDLEPGMSPTGRSYRVFLLFSSMQVDLSFWPWAVGDIRRIGRVFPPALR